MAGRMTKNGVVWEMRELRNLDFVPEKVVTRLGIEPRTYGLRVRCSAS